MSKADLEINELRREHKDLSALINNPNVAEERKRIYRTTLKTIERKLGELQAAVAPPTAPSLPPRQNEGGSAFDKFRDPAEQQEYEAPKSPSFAPQATQGPSAPQGRTEAEVETAAPTQSETHVYTALVSDNRTVVIMWEGEEAKTYRLDALPGLFRSRLAELAASKDAERQLWHLLPTTRTFYRAVGFLKAIAEAWRRMPTANELDVDGRNETRMTIFNLIAEAVEKEGK